MPGEAAGLSCQCHLISSSLIKSVLFVVGGLADADARPQ